MATTSSSSCFCPYAMTRPTRVRAPRTPSSKKPIPPNPNPNHKQLRHRTGAKELASVGVEATTYTRLPPKDDFSLPSLLEFSSEVKLSESSVAVEKEKKKKEKVEEKEIADLSDEEEDDGGDGKFEVFEGSYDSELEDDEIEGVEYEYEEIERESDGKVVNLEALKGKENFGGANFAKTEKDSILGNKTKNM